MKGKSFLFKTSFFENLSEVLRYAFFNSLVKYYFDGEEPDFNKFGFTTDTEKMLAKQLWTLMIDVIDDSKKE